MIKIYRYYSLFFFWYKNVYYILYKNNKLSVDKPCTDAEHYAFEIDIDIARSINDIEIGKYDTIIAKFILRLYGKDV